MVSWTSVMAVLRPCNSWLVSLLLFNSFCHVSSRCQTGTNLELLQNVLKAKPVRLAASTHDGRPHLAEGVHSTALGHGTRSRSTSSTRVILIVGKFPGCQQTLCLGESTLR